ncbi:hypothetical protein L3X38_025984 [Prunus dulcis]|uniref:Uncharacterized protein n=1 Tax=Prunus dulcis TaxID=3755 RepID=A0AAD4W2P8_PRUDU|nr:hypothetical protein L3X38_025984 [Prunus dulcis]
MYIEVLAVGCVDIILVLTGRDFGIEQITGETAEFSAGVKVENSIRRAIRSIVPDIRQVSDTHRVRLEFQSGIWFGSCQFGIRASQMMVRPGGELRRHRVVAILETTDLDLVPVEVPAKVVVLETALGLVQPEVSERQLLSGSGRRSCP